MSVEVSDLTEAEESKTVKIKSQIMLITFFDVRGIVHSEFLPQGQTIIQQVYEEILPLLLRSVRVRPGNQAPEMSVEVSDLTEAEESKTVKIKKSKSC